MEHNNPIIPINHNPNEMANRTHKPVGAFTLLVEVFPDAQFFAHNNAIIRHIIPIINIIINKMNHQDTILI